MAKDKNINTLIIPDVHCREFWKLPVHNTLHEYPDADIVFMGDYYDPYDFEWQPSDNPLETGYNNFKQIIELAKDNPNVKILVGNHDISYIGSPDLCYCRHDWNNDKRNRDLFWDNYELLTICYEKEINNKNYLFSHAGYIEQWLTCFRNKDYFKTVNNEETKLSDFLNNKFKMTFEGYITEADKFWNVMGQYDNYRGADGNNYASIVWTDIRTHIDWSKNFENDKTIQVFGHTYLNTDYININNNRYCLDSQQCFYVDDDGDIRKYNDDEILCKTI